MANRPLLSAWIWLVALSLTTTAASLGAGPILPAAVAGAAILIFAWFKTRLILARYLGLNRVPPLRRGFDLAMALYVALLLGLYLVPSI